MVVNAISENRPKPNFVAAAVPNDTWDLRFCNFFLSFSVVCSNAGTDGDHSRAGSFFLALRKDLFEHRGLRSGWGGQCL